MFYVLMILMGLVEIVEFICEIGIILVEKKFWDFESYID